MTPELLERHLLSLRFWLQRIVLPAAVVMLILLLLLRMILGESKQLDQNALIIAFFTVYFVLVRGGHMIMIRSLHFDLMRRSEVRYRELLARHKPQGFHRRNLGFTLAKIKRELIDEGQSKRDQFRRK